MRYWIEVTNIAGARVGRIDNLLYWRTTPRLDRAGEIEFSLPASDPKAALLTNKCRVTCYAIIGEAVTAMGAGIVEEITTTWAAGQSPALVVKGGDLLRELSIHLTVFGENTGPAQITNVNGPALLLSLAETPWFPGTWSLSGPATTQMLVYMRIWHDSILNGLVQIAQVTGEHFRLGTGRQVVWLGPASNFTSSGIVATTTGDITAMESNPNACLITDIQEIKDSWDQWTRIYLFGSGEGEARLTLLAADTWPEGFENIGGGGTTMTYSGSNAYGRAGGVGTDQYQVSRVSSMLENNNASIDYGYLMKAVVFKNIAPISNTDADLAAASNMLLKAGYQYLRTRTQPQRFYRLTVTALDTIINVGTTIRVYARGVYEDASGIASYLDINNQDFYVLEADQQIDARGVRTLALTVATTDRWPESDSTVVMEPLSQAMIMQALPQMGPNESTVSYTDIIDNDYDLDLAFWLSSAVTTVNQVILRFRVDPLRSPIRQMRTALTTIGGTGINGVVHVHFENGGMTDPADPFHFHNMEVSYGVFEQSGNTLGISEMSVTYKQSGGSFASAGTPAAIGSTGWYELDATSLLTTTANRPGRSDNVLRISAAVATANISSISESGGAVSVTTATSHGLANGDSVRIRGTSNYNQVVQIRSVAATTFVFSTTNTGTATETTGTVERYKSARIVAQIERRTVIQSIATV